MANTLENFDFASLVGDPTQGTNSIVELLQRQQIEDLAGQQLGADPQGGLSGFFSGGGLLGAFQDQFGNQQSEDPRAFGTPPPDLAGGILPGATTVPPRSTRARKKQNLGLIKLQSLDPAMAEFVQTQITTGKLEDLASAQKNMNRNVTESQFLLGIKDAGKLRSAIEQTIQERASEGLPSPALDKMLQMQDEEIPLQLRKRKVTNTGAKTLLANEQKQLDRESRERIATQATQSAQGIAAAARGAKAIPEDVIDVSGGLQQRRRLNPATQLMEPVGEPFDPSVLSPAKLAEARGIKEQDSARDFLNASLLEEKKLDIKEKSKTGVLKRKKLESEIKEIGLNEQKKEFRRKSKIAKADLVLGKIVEASEFIKENWFTTGFMGGLLQSIGGTDARNLRGMIDTIKANIGFAELQAMRDASPTGGALGQVAVQEINFLQSTIAALDQAQDDNILLQNLEQVAESMRRIKKIQLDSVGATEGNVFTFNPATGKLEP